MKKVLVIVFVLTCLLGLVGCDPGMNMIDEDELVRNTVKIELVDYENLTPKKIRINGKNDPVFDFSKTTLIATLEDSLVEAVAQDISKTVFMVYPTTMNEPIGKTMILYQSDGRMIVLFGGTYQNKTGGTKNYGGCNIFDEKGLFIESIGVMASDYIVAIESKYFAK